MGSLVFIFMTLLVMAQGSKVQVINQCYCDEFSSQTDCREKTGCSWSSNTSTCSNIITTPTPTANDGYCELISDATQCANTKGCAYTDSTCVIFAGCTAYKGTTDTECQSISRYCNSDKIAYCKNPGSCSSYKTEEICTGKASNGGSGICVWDVSLCRDQKCIEADQTFNTDAQCNNFIKGCVTNGKGCVATFGTCSSYSGDIETCEGLIGKDGNCKGVSGGTKCQAKICTEADTSLTTDQACEAYQKGCVTTGYGCVKAPLGVCSTQTGDDVVCANKRGYDGKCKGVTNGKNCSPITCSDAVETLSTDKDCDTFKKGCVTTGKGCISTKGLCQTYKGTSETCVGYVGSDGYCKGASDKGAACSPKVCKDADSTLNTDEQCNEYQIGCKTTGKGCVATLSNCSSYTGDSTTCEGYIGQDGKCKGSQTSGPCSPKVCSEASTSFKTNEECTDYQIGCIASENGGCILAGECSTLLSQYQCSGKKSCQWNPQCVKNTVCSDLSSEILCKTVKLQNGKTCWWVSQSCIDRECTQAPTSYDSDSLCDSFLTGCLTKKKGCLSSTESCTGYQGSKATCESFTIKCTNADAADETTDCQNKTCGSNTTATSDSDCDSYHKGCLTKGTGCIDSTAPCSSYDGTSVETCKKFTGNNIKCWWTASNSKCEDKACSHADSTYTTDFQCEQFLSGCVTTLSGCKKYFSQGVQCVAEKDCSQIIGATSQQSCEDVLPELCMFVKDQCIKISYSCSDYKHDTADLSVADCQILKTKQGQFCYWSTGQACVSRSCDQITGVGVTLATCQAHMQDCAAITDGSGCEFPNCSNASNKTNNAGCQQYHPICRYNSSDSQKCINNSFCYNFTKGNCSAITTYKNYQCAEPSSGTVCMNAVCLGQASCESVEVYQKGLCVLYNSVCEVRSCAKAVNHIITALTLSSQCLTYLQDCVLTYEGGSASCTIGAINTNPGNYGCAIIQGTADQCKTLQGIYFINNKYVPILCASHDQGNTISACFDRTCNDIQQTTDTDCQDYLSSCKSDGTKCIELSTPCSSLLSSSEGCAIFTGLTIGSKCQDNTTLSCNSNLTATTDSDCDKHLKGCITTGNGCTVGTTLCSSQNGNQEECKLLTGNGNKCWSISATSGPCIDRLCSHDTASTTDRDCDSFLKDCVTKGTGCIEKTAECSTYQGSQTACEKFIGNGKSCTNDSTATSTTYCKVKDCSKLTSDSYSESICQAYGKHCHFNGTKCDIIQTCSSLKGNFITCAAYIASDGSCKATSLQTEAPTNCQQASCSDAPNTLTTDFDCELYKKRCVTNGRGCAEQVNCGDVSIESSCLAVKSNDTNICTWASQCRDLQSTCSSYSTFGQSVCQNTKISKGFGFCVWKNSTCTELTCEDIPLTVTSENDCNIYSTNCTFAGIGCVTKSFCKSYNTKEVCINAKSKDLVGQCSWDETFSTGTLIVGCRAMKCSDAQTSITTDEDCQAFIPGCKTNGAGCKTPPFECKDFKTSKKCFQDFALRPCLWYNETCIQYYKCEDLPLKTISACQEVSKYCTSDSTKCITIQTCASYSKSFQCQIGKDGQCGYVTANKKCQLFTQCTDLLSKVNSECNIYNSKCISNGTSCIDLAECSTYADSEQACKQGGTDGSCFYDKDLTACRLRQCSDATTSTNTHNGCYGFYINNKTKCTTDGKSCIPLANCSTYTQAGCVMDANLKSCIFDKLSNSCKLKACIDIKKTKSSECASSLTGCVSNGTNCISKAKCSEYTFKESCSAGGTDGNCVFSPSSAQSLIGKCKVFTQCSDANFDQLSCQSKSAACKWTQAQGTKSSSCTVHTCDTAAKGTKKCITVPNFDASTYEVCVVQKGKCVQGDPSTLLQETCYRMSQYTYTWNTKAQKCQVCVVQNTSQNKNSVDNKLNQPQILTNECSIMRLIVATLLVFII